MKLPPIRRSLVRVPAAISVALLAAAALPVACERDDGLTPETEDIFLAERISLQHVGFSELPTFDALVQPGRVLWSGRQTDSSNRAALLVATRQTSATWDIARTNFLEEASGAGLRRIAGGILASAFEPLLGDARAALYYEGAPAEPLLHDSEPDNSADLFGTTFATPYGLLFRRDYGTRDSFALAWLPTGASESVEVARLPGSGNRQLNGIATDGAEVFGVFSQQAFTPAVVTQTPFRFSLAEPTGSFQSGDPVATPEAILWQFHTPGVVGGGVYTYGRYDQRPELLRWTLPALSGGVAAPLDDSFGPDIWKHATTVTAADGSSRAFARDLGRSEERVRELQPGGFREVWNSRRLSEVRLTLADTVATWETLLGADELFRVFHAEDGLVYVRNAHFVVAVDETDGRIARIWTAAGAPAGGRDEQARLTDAYVANDSVYVAAISPYDLNGVDVFYAAFPK